MDGSQIWGGRDWGCWLVHGDHRSLVQLDLRHHQRTRRVADGMVRYTPNPLLGDDEKRALLLALDEMIRGGDVPGGPAGGTALGAAEGAGLGLGSVPSLRVPFPTWAIL